MILKGNAWIFGEDINTDLIIPARYLNTRDPQELARHCMEDADPNFVEKLQPGDFIVAGKNFGCGSSREHAPISLKAAGISGIIAVSFARIFFRNAMNLGLPIWECPEAAEAIQNGDWLIVDANKGSIELPDKGEVYQAAPLPDFIQELISHGGLVNYVRQKMGKPPLENMNA